MAANVQDQISRVEGVGDTTLFGAQYAMRVWLDPSKLNNFKLTPADVSTAISAQNAQVSAGQLGGLPATAGQQLNATITSQTRLQTAAEFENIILRTQTDGSSVRLRDVARIELGSENYGSVAHFNGKPATGLAIKLATGANALDTVHGVDAKLAELGKFYPTGMKAYKPYDTTPFVRISIEEVIKTLIEAVVPPAVSELGNATGFDLMLQDRGNVGHAALMQARNQLLCALAQEKGLVGVRPNGLEDTAQFKLEIDAQKAGALGLSMADINATFSAAWGSSYVNDFIDQGRVKKVFLQADAQFRMLPGDIDRWFVRNSSGAMVPFSAFATASWTSGSPRLERYNSVPSVEILGMGLPGVLSSGEAMDLVEKHAAELPAGIGYEWTGLSKQERASRGQSSMLYAVSILVVFLCLAALYESWAIPL